jgi:hypothetical protein
MDYPITGGIVKIDPEDLELVSRYKWHKNDMGYAVWRGIMDGKKQTVRMHRLINDTPEGLNTDHINHDRLDNRRSNLRTVTQSGNMRNLTDQGKGYWYHRKNANWVVEIHGKHRGTFQLEDEAAAFAELVRQGKADMKPELVPVVCWYGHSLRDAYIFNGRKHCKPCQAERSREYHRRKKLRLQESM